MKRVFSLVGQTILFLVVFLGGTLWDPFHLKWFVTHPARTSTRFFVPDGLILMVGVYLLILALEAGRRRLAISGLWSTAAFLLALFLGLLSKFGLATHDLF